MKTHPKLKIPETTAWDKSKTYNPYTLFDRWLYNNFQYSWFHNCWDKFIDIPIGNFQQGIINLWKWFPIIWKDRSWDDHYIFEIIKHKLLLQREELIGANRHTGIETINRDITLCLNLIERIQEESYEIEYQDYWKQNFEFIDTGKEYDGEKTYAMEFTTVHKDLIPYFSKYINTYKKLRRFGYKGRTFKKEEDETIALYIGMYNQEKCQRLLFKILNEKIRHWWD